MKLIELIWLANPLLYPAISSVCSIIMVSFKIGEIHNAQAGYKDLINRLNSFDKNLGKFDEKLELKKWQSYPQVKNLSLLTTLLDEGKFFMEQIKREIYLKISILTIFLLISFIIVAMDNLATESKLSICGTLLIAQMLYMNGKLPINKLLSDKWLLIEPEEKTFLDNYYNLERFFYEKFVFNKIKNHNALCEEFFRTCENYQYKDLSKLIEDNLRDVPTALSKIAFIETVTERMPKETKG